MISTSPNPVPSPAAKPAPPGLPVLMSASMPQAIAGTMEAQRVYALVAAVVRGLFDIGAELIFGGHPTITPLVHRLAVEHQGPPPRISLYQLERCRTKTPPETNDQSVFGQVHWLGDPASAIADDLAALRTPMATLIARDLAIRAGGAPR